MFAGPKNEQTNFKKLNKNDKGREGLFGDTQEKDAYERKVNLAAVISQKESTRAPVFDSSTADERKMREQYGNSNYQPQKKEYKREFKPAQTGMDAVLDRNTKSKVAAQLNSNILANDDQEIYEARGQWNQNAEKLQSSSSGWAAQQNMKKSTNTGGVDAYRQKQNQLNSNVFEQTDHS